MTRFIEPFGEPDCKAEILSLEDRYRSLYFDRGVFSDTAIDDAVCLIIGRRGSGKTALARYFSFQTKLDRALCLHIDEPEAYQRVLSRLSVRASRSPVIAIPRLVKAWEYVIWSTIFAALGSDLPTIDAAVPPQAIRSDGLSRRVANLFAFLMEMIEGGGVRHAGVDDFDELVTDATFQRSVKRVQNYARVERPIIISFDTLEKHDLSDRSFLHALAALVRCARLFTAKNAQHRVYLKVFLTAEVYPVLSERGLLNPLVDTKHALRLSWRPGDLLRLMAWRLMRYLVDHGHASATVLDESFWQDALEVKKRVWRPFFGETVTAPGRPPEETLSYLFRHSHMRPRQLIVVCNAIAQKAYDSGRFPTSDIVQNGVFLAEDIVEVVEQLQKELANDVINAYSVQYRNAPEIIAALERMPAVFRGADLADCAASLSAEVDPARAFTRIVTELGVVGRVSERLSNGDIAADFEYATGEQIRVLRDDECVIHPMFSRHLRVVSDGSRVMPFPIQGGMLDEMSSLSTA